MPTGSAKDDGWHCHHCRNVPLDFWTAWTPLGNITAKEGLLALIPGSHRLGGYERPMPTPRGEVALLPGDSTLPQRKGAQWVRPSHMGKSDIIIFNFRSIHAATKNTTEKYRLSLDTRFTTCKKELEQPADASTPARTP